MASDGALQEISDAILTAIWNMYITDSTNMDDNIEAWKE